MPSLSSGDMENMLLDSVVDEMAKETEANNPNDKRSDKEHIRDLPFFENESTEAPRKQKFQMGCKEVFGITIPKGLPNVPVTVFKKGDWDKDMQSHIPEIDKNYQFQPKQLIELLVGLNLNDNVWISGATGSGKSSLVEQVCAYTNRPFARINGRGDMESGAIFGQYVLEDGKTIWKDGVCTEAVKNGMVYCQDEPTVLPPEIAMGYQWLLENGGKLMLTDKAGDTKDKLVSPHKHFRFVCCDNTKGLGDEMGAFAGTNVWNTATLDRFSTSIQLDYLPKNKEVEVIKAKCPNITEKLASYMVQFAGLVRIAYAQGNVSFTMSPRTLLSWGEKALYYKDINQALKSSYYSKLPNDIEKVAIEEMFATVFAKRL
tara:strand:- start:18067 stop:19185 length:1119 start_codon:yes stop_codon:yes gene_type:complete